MCFGLYKSVSNNYVLCCTGDCTPLMEAASGGYADIVKLLIDHGADVNAKSAAGMYCNIYTFLFNFLFCVFTVMKIS